MVSVIICSVNERYLAQVKENIASTIGVEYELLVWNNLSAGKGICEVYNLLAHKARFETLLFIHEDIIFETNAWGTKLETLLINDTGIGVIGVAGCKYKSRYFSGWYTGITELDCARITHRYPKGDEELLLQPDPGKAGEEVVCIDGVFICCRKEIWKKCPFDEAGLKGFHFYDIDFSIRARQLAKVFVTYEIQITHVTVGGDFGNKWVDAAIAYHQASGSLLPQDITNVNHDAADKTIIKTWFDVLKNYPVSWRNKFRWIRLQRLGKEPGYFYSILKLFLYNPLGLSRVHRLWKKK